MAASPADEPAPWESVITRPDPMTAEERAAWLECELDEGPDPDEVQYEDDFWYPGTDLTEAELADPAGVARVLAGESSSAAAGFGTG
jgi:hypothetical protein